MEEEEEAAEVDEGEGDDCLVAWDGTGDATGAAAKAGCSFGLR